LLSSPDLLALGARPRDLARMVVGEGIRFAAAGVAIGALVALGAGRWVRPLLFAQSPGDPLVFGLVAGVLLLVAAAASLVPARRAAGVDPNLTLRAE
jgi:ABC-type antimicrobial peptide transport system permease subunit